MPPARKTLGFLLRLAVLYALLVLPWPGLAKGYAAGYRTGISIIFTSLGPYGSISARALDPPQGNLDTQLRYTPRSPRLILKKPVSSWELGYLPLVTLVALVLATPISWRRRLWALLCGFLLVNAFVALRAALLIVNAYYSSTGIPGHTPSPVWQAVLKGLTVALAEAPVSFFIVPLLIWALVSFRRGDWVAMRSDQGYTTDEKKGPADDDE